MAPRSATTAGADAHGDGASGEVNRVELEGRLPAVAETRTLPSGDQIVTFRVIVKRVPAASTGATVDTLDCVTWSRGLGERVLRWPAGSRVSVEGSLRRRFWRTSAGVASRTEVEVARARLVRGSSPSDVMRN